VTAVNPYPYCLNSDVNIYITMHDGDDTIINVIPITLYRILRNTYIRKCHSVNVIKILQKVKEQIKPLIAFIEFISL
jgi:hypothetical protein